MTLQFGASLTDDTRSGNYDGNTFIIQATGQQRRPKKGFGAFTHPTNSVPTIFFKHKYCFKILLRSKYFKNVADDENFGLTKFEKNTTNIRIIVFNN